MKKITMFYGKECPHCHVMLPLADKLSKEEKIKVEKVEVWHDQKNADRMRALRNVIEPACGGSLGVPVFVDEKNKRAFCGEQPYTELKKWAKLKS